jgi:hypothetical protein
MEGTIIEGKEVEYMGEAWEKAEILTATCSVIRVTKITGSSSDDWIY